ncbi:hypothetical protein CSW37_03795 [Thermus scotoductus]|jgi:hypothetical protein|uniref:Uncharacterized protein n=3 Tax=Thermus TaxID=270 RepID=A0A348XRL2_THESC|nr:MULTISPECIES: hypothetical protein [Thermus]ETN89021.1 membrane protein [Thermus sp. NMX2.A1]MBW6393606.1 hypothetical protein [Thermus brevis]QWK21868.1 MAG: hypothetical protein KNN15_12810 [Thermus antranikianii]RTG93241.1 hypothetical protein CSW51_09550 [Thermus scotoductus]RTG93822.1 hypothetical protein CSW49_09780 [Thermus scotoductus]
MRTLSLVLAVVALLLLLPALLPLLGWLNWVVLPLALLAAGLGLLSGEERAFKLGLLLMVVSALRLFLGGGFL